MRLRINFGDSDSSEEIFWWKPLEDFPKILEYDGHKWSWFMYDTDKTKTVDYILTFTKIPTYDPYYGVYAPTLDQLIANPYGPKCECGSESIHGPKGGHSYWCPKYVKL